MKQFNDLTGKLFGSLKVLAYAGTLPIPLDIGDAHIPRGMNDADFNLLIETLQLWKKKIVADDFTTYHGQPPTKEELGD